MFQSGTQHALRPIAVALLVLIASLLCGAVGLIVGSWYGGNYCNACEFNGLRGYEAAGQLGLLGGSLVGLLLSIALLSMRTHARRRRASAHRGSSSISARR
jgi:hypothetical protein